MRNIGITEIDKISLKRLPAAFRTTLDAGCETGFGLSLTTALLVGFHDGMLDNVATEDSSSGNDDVLEVWSCGVLELISWSWTTPCVFFYFYFFAVW